MKDNRFVRWFTEHKKRSIIIGVVVLLLLVGGYLFYRLKIADSVERTDPATTEAEEVSTTVPSPLTGLQVTPEEAKRPVTAVVIENSPDARPHSGLEQAGVVYEAIAEGGITRFLALYQEARPALIGPVRSLRPYFIDWGW